MHSSGAAAKQTPLHPPPDFSQVDQHYKTDLYGPIHRYTALYFAIHCYTSLYTAILFYTRGKYDRNTPISKVAAFPQITHDRD